MRKVRIDIFVMTNVYFTPGEKVARNILNIHALLSQQILGKKMEIFNRFATQKRRYPNLFVNFQILNYLV